MCHDLPAPTLYHSFYFSTDFSFLPFLLPSFSFFSFLSFSFLIFPKRGKILPYLSPCSLHFTPRLVLYPNFKHLLGPSSCSTNGVLVTLNHSVQFFISSLPTRSHCMLLVHVLPSLRLEMVWLFLQMVHYRNSHILILK